ncbi:unnamed protein product [Debaryomyces tyrocola]|nr:unnamed protein product [Debaryomyces tyrocola]
MSTQIYLDAIKDKLYGDSTVAKIWGVALPALSESKPPTEFPDYSKGSRYSTKDADYWTSGFFPGSLYELLERNDKFPGYFPSKKVHPVKLEYAARWWTHPLKSKATKTDNHDIGFMIEPSFNKELEHSGDKEARDVLITAANSLATRFDAKVGCIRSWDHFFETRPSSFEKDLIVIIDNMCNLNLLYTGAQLNGDLRLSTIATTHAETTMKNHFRDDWSSYHVVVYDRKTGKAAKKHTAQGYSDESSWTRGQAWGILGYTETYYFTKSQKFLDTAKRIVKYYLSHLPEDGVPPWDFHAPDKNIRDVSSGMVAAFGMLKIYEYTKEEEYLNNALKLVNDCTKLCFNKQSKLNDDGTVDLGDTDTILNGSTFNNNPNAPEEYKIFDHGLVYTDYYFLMIGNKLLELGLYK